MKKSLYEYYIEDLGLEQLDAEIRRFESTLNADAFANIDESIEYSRYFVDDLKKAISELIKNESQLYKLVNKK